MIKQIRFNVALTVVTAAIPVLSKIFVNNASVSMKMIRVVLIHLLEMVTARMSQIMRTLVMMEEIAVCLLILQIIAQIALVIYLRLVQLDFYLLQLEMDIVMITQIMLSVATTMETAVFLMLLQIIA